VLTKLQMWFLVGHLLPLLHLIVTVRVTQSLMLLKIACMRMDHLCQIIWLAIFALLINHALMLEGTAFHACQMFIFALEERAALVAASTPLRRRHLRRPSRRPPAVTIARAVTRAWNNGPM